MTTLIFIENVLGSGQMIKLTEDFGDYVVTRDLGPGQNARLVVSPFRAITVEEIQVSQPRLAPANEEQWRARPSAPRSLERRYG